MADINELHKLLEEEGTKATSSPIKGLENKEVLKFISNTQIKPGSHKVPGYIIYYHFVKWCSTSAFRRKWKKEAFFREFKKHFELKRTGKQRCYLIDESLDLSLETIEKAREYDEKYEKNNKRKSKK